ncbi:BON domain-containing protein [Paraburkholderia sp. BL17N1]|uniref:BON domain-containing protein n=1 Tax=Paraburkholderia sp. BL17N1 TaxID=1938798 RepID=UPI000EAB6F06|nr:BON domain-containing protein [Paraburkholderia sp. BL17N1]RKR36225.1 BON domain-containing protein [Paraburkholderia sp. BL17N1]
MNAFRTLKAGSIGMIVFASVHAWAQENGTTETSAATQSTSKSSIRKANLTLSKTVIRALHKGGVDTMNINALAKNGAVTLAGSVPDPSQIDKAGSIAEGVSGVSSVRNNLTIHETGN